MIDGFGSLLTKSFVIERIDGRKELLGKKVLRVSGSHVRDNGNISDEGVASVEFNM